MFKCVIDVEEFQYHILNEVNSERLNKILENRSDEYRSGVIFGLSWAGILTSECSQYALKENKNAEV